jgi:hypothetical protein
MFHNTIVSLHLDKKITKISDRASMNNNKDILDHINKGMANLDKMEVD